MPDAENAAAGPADSRRSLISFLHLRPLPLHNTLIPWTDEVSIVDMILLDWTRMGRTFCVAGAVVQAGQYRVVRPLLARYRDRSEERRVGKECRSRRSAAC